MAENKFINDMNYKVSKYTKDNVRTWICPIYDKWIGMKARTKKSYIDTRPTYANILVHDDWYYFSNFHKWMTEHPVEEKYFNYLHLDKDLKDTKCKLYSPDTCTLIPYYINDAIRISAGSRGIYPLGVSKENTKGRAKKIYKTSVRIFGVLKNLGRYETPFEAHKNWQLGKIDYINQIIEKYKTEPFYYKDVEDSLIIIRDKIQYEYDNNMETTYL